MCRLLGNCSDLINWPGSGKYLGGKFQAEYLLMTKLFFYSLTYGSSFIALFFPWVGVVTYYIFNVLHPQSIWSWIFGYFHASKLIAIGTFIGFLIKVLSGRIDFSRLMNRQNGYLVCLWLFIIISYFFNSYGYEPFRDIKMYSASTFNPVTIMSNMNKALLFYFVSILLIDRVNRIKSFAAIILFTCVYYIIWAHIMYFSGEMYTVYGARLGGPAMRGIYSDQNVFAMLFVISIPFLFFIGDYFRHNLVKCLFWGWIPFAWHAVFLTGSLGGLIGLFVVMSLIAVRSRKKIFWLAIPVALCAALVAQGGNYLLARIDVLLGGLSGVDTATSRFDSWMVGLKMIIDNPLVGVGPGNFIKAYSDYSAATPFVAHNTLIQFASESGIVAGLMYLFVCWELFKRNLSVPDDNGSRDALCVALQNSIFCSIGGYFVCSMFLNLATYELIYYLLILNLAVHLQYEDNGAG